MLIADVERPDGDERVVVSHREEAAQAALRRLVDSNQHILVVQA